MNKKNNIWWLIAGLVLLYPVPPLGAGMLVYAGLNSRKTQPLITWLAFGVLAIVIVILIFIFFVFDKAVHFA